jgi:hypothetical protein
MPSEKRCPDGGRCWHACGEMCWRVRSCAPLGMEEWPPEVVAKHNPGDLPGDLLPPEFFAGGDHADA